MKPAATLIMTRRLFLIASLRDMDMHTILVRRSLYVVRCSKADI